MQTAEPISAQGQMALTLPGGQVRLDGKATPTQGAGTVDIQLTDVAMVQHWIESLPGVSNPLAGARMQGAATLQTSWQGGWQSVQQRISGSKAPPPGAKDLQVQAMLRIPQFTIHLPPPQDKTAPSTPPIELRRIEADLTGRPTLATLTLQSEVLHGTYQADLQTQIEAGIEKTGQWRATLARLQLQAQEKLQPTPWKLQLDTPLQLDLRTTDEPTLAVTASAASVSLTGPLPGTVQASWGPLQYKRTSNAETARHTLQTTGRLQGLPLAWARTLTATTDMVADNLGIYGNVVFDGQWNIDLGDTLNAHAQLSRASGDIQLQTDELGQTTAIISSGASVRTKTTRSDRPMLDIPAGTSANAGLRQAQITLDVAGENVQAQLVWDSQRAGQVKAQASTRLEKTAGRWQWATDAPLTGTVQAHLPNIGAWSMFAPPGWRVQGSMDADAQLSGTRTAPLWRGTLAADEMSLRSVVDGVDLRDGRLRATLNGERIDITEFRLHGSAGPNAHIRGYGGNRGVEPTSQGGVLSGTGFLTWSRPGTSGPTTTDSGSGIRMEFNAEASALRVLVRSDRQIALSGSLQALLEEGQLTLRANLKTDRATIILPDQSAPRLGQDVVVRSAATTAAQTPAPESSVQVQTAKPPQVFITFDLGDDFAVQGHGLTSRLTGALEIRSTEGFGTMPRVTGEIRTERGQYRAYGQQLDIETGLLYFNGVMDNPSLDILALRPNISIRAGVQITGTAQSPRVRLYSNPALPDAETLSWVVLGHSSANGGAEAALLQQAALSLFGRRGSESGGVANRVGLDEVGLRGPSTGEDASGTVLTLGKRISQNVYVTFESGLSGALGTLFIFYDLTRNLTLRAQTGNRSAVDLIYTVPFD